MFRRVVLDKVAAACRAVFAELEPRLRRFGYSFEDWTRGDVPVEFASHYLHLS